MGKRVAIGGIWHETNTFAAGLTGLEAFERYQFATGEALLERYRGTGTELGGMIGRASAHDFELVPTVFAGAVPSATISRAALDRVCDEMTRRLQDPSVDGMLIVLHGAAAAEEIDDADAYVLERVRSVLGSERPIVGTFDFHANLSEWMVTGADILIGYDTFPHVDMAERGAEAADLLARLLDAPHRPRRVLVKVPLLTVPQKQATDRAPTSEVMDLLREVETREGVWCASVALGFPYADSPNIGASVIVYADTDAQAEQAANALGSAIWQRREAFLPELEPVEAAVAEAIGCDRTPVVLVDPADNVGGGSAGDGTLILDALLRAGAEGAAIVVADPGAVTTAERAGEGGNFDGLVGGQTDHLHGDPVRVKGRVRLLTDGHYVHKGSYMTGFETSMGRTAVIDAGGVQIVLTSLRTMPFDAEQLRCVGIEPAEQRIIVVKSASAWRAAYGPVARHTIMVDTPGVCASNVERLAYHRCPRPMFPLERDFEFKRPTTTEVN